MEINYVISLGSLCITAAFLKRNNLKTASYPFDWIFSNCNMIIQCLTDDFNIFLDKSYYISKTNTSCVHTYYHKLENDISTFNHHNPLINENDYNYFIRCRDRLKKVLNNEKHKLFIVTFLGCDLIDDSIKTNFIKFNDDFSKYTHNYTLLIMLNIPDKDTNYHEFTYYNNIHFLEIHTKSNVDGVFFEDDNDNIYWDNILVNNYNFNLEK